MPKAYVARHALSRRQALASGGAAGLLAAVGLGGNAQAQGRAPLLRYGLSTWPPNLQPWVSTGVSAGTIKMLTHGRLMRFDATGKLV
ncbi:MAG TPA: hypothetical protein PK264_09345, partial [Hyphomicrobiaceae bacterium]|nr:hypothetical protein [Hyphomicrobiaceae bacterium]